MPSNAEVFEGVLSEMLEIERATLADDVGPATLKKWNSMTHMKLVARLEQAFEVRFKVRDVVRVKCVGDLRRLLGAQGVELG